MSEKMKCARCGKRFKQANKKQVFCGECLKKERTAKKAGPQLVSSSSGYATSGSPRNPEASAPTTGITIVAATPPPETGSYGAKARYDERRTQQTQPRPPQTQTQTQTQAQSPERMSQPAQATSSEQPAAKKPAASTPSDKAAASPKAANGLSDQPEKRSRPPRPTAPPFQLTDEMRAAIEQRYLELSQPVEFDGIRTRIAGELSVPKPVVKQVVKELRANRQLPSWWELQAYKGNDEILNRIRERYVPLLPVPPIGIHKQIASELQLEAPQVYQAIRRLRAEMKLPQYNPPQSHENEKPPAGVASSVTADSATTTSPKP